MTDEPSPNAKAFVAIVEQLPAPHQAAIKHLLHEMADDVRAGRPCVSGVDLERAFEALLAMYASPNVLQFPQDK